MSPKPLPKLPDYNTDAAIDIQNLTFRYSSDSRGSTLDTDRRSSVLNNLTLQLPQGAKCLLIGSNGSGKSTLLNILSGRRLAKQMNDTDPFRCNVLGLNSFHDTRLNFHRAFLACDWGMSAIPFVGASVPLMADMPVCEMMQKLQNDYADRRDELARLLAIDVENWRMHQLSEGQRRRVQIMLGLLRPFKLLLLDEITTSLDVCVRQDFLRWLANSPLNKDATMLYATHIFDGLDDWPTHVVYLNRQGAIAWQGTRAELQDFMMKKNIWEQSSCKMLALAEHWLRQEHSGPEKAAGSHAPDPTDYSQGGYASGRLFTDEEILERKRRHGEIPR